MNEDEKKEVNEKKKKCMKNKRENMDDDEK